MRVDGKTLPRTRTNSNGHPEDSRGSGQTGTPGESSPRWAGSCRYTRSARQLVGRYVRERECVNGELKESRVMGWVAL